MTKIKKLIDIEETLLKLESKYKFQYTLDELIKSNRYIKEIGNVTDIFFSVQCEYSSTLNPLDNELEVKLKTYQDSLLNHEIDIDVTEYINFIIQLKKKVSDDELMKLIENATATN